MNIQPVNFLVMFLVGLMLTACGTVKRGSVASPSPEEKQEEPAVKEPNSSETGEQSEIRDFLELAYKDWKGVPYALGGSGFQGIDCSAFMQVVFEDYFMRKIPRTTKEQLAIGAAVSKSQLKAGDMVFFKTGRRTFHVGVMMGERQFLHASTTSGVITSDITHEFWEATYLSARRILTDY